MVLSIFLYSLFEICKLKISVFRSWKILLYLFRIHRWQVKLKVLEFFRTVYSESTNVTDVVEPSVFFAQISLFGVRRYRRSIFETPDSLSRRSQTYFWNCLASVFFIRGSLIRDLFSESSSVFCVPCSSF